jgi:hypothetical protein
LVAAAVLFTEAATVATLRFLTLVYSVARTGYAPDRAHLGGTVIALWVGVTIAVTGVLVGAAVASRRHPGRAWAGARIGGRLCLILAWALNAALAGWAIVGIARDHRNVVGTVAWLVAALAAGVVLAAATIDVAASRRSARRS